MNRRACLLALSSFAATPSIAQQGWERRASWPRDDVFGPDAGPALSAAQDVAIRNGTMLVDVPPGALRIRTGIKIRYGVTWRLNGSVLSTDVPTIDVFSADGVDNWSIIGRGSIVGSRTSGVPQSGQNGVVIRDAAGFYIEALSARNLAGTGFHLHGDRSVSRGDGRQFNNVASSGCSVGRRIDAGAGGEFSTWTAWHASGNGLADMIAAGNTSTIGGVISQNDAGIDLRPGPNHGHGRYVGVTIAHNDQFNVLAQDIWNGFTFTDCSVYENNVHLTGSRGIWFRGGIFDARVIYERTSEARANGVDGAYMPGDYFPTPVVDSGPNDDRTGLDPFVFVNCSGYGAPSS
jgi:hypothetical protein